MKSEVQPCYRGNWTPNIGTPSFSPSFVPSQSSPTAKNNPKKTIVAPSNDDMSCTPATKEESKSCLINQPSTTSTPVKAPKLTKKEENEEEERKAKLRGQRITGNHSISFRHSIFLSHIYNGHITEAEEFLEKNPECVNDKDTECSVNALSMAAGLTNADSLVKALLNAGISPNQSCDHGMIPLHASIFGGDIKAAELLLQYGTEPDIIYCGVSPLTLAIKLEKIPFVELLLEFEANPNFHDKISPLDVAIQKRSLKMCRLLLQHNANPNESKSALFPLLRAIQLEYYEIADILIEHGADIPSDAKPNYAAPILEVSLEKMIQEKYFAIARFLLQKGIDYSSSFILNSIFGVTDYAAIDFVMKNNPSRQHLVELFSWTIESQDVKVLNFILGNAKEYDAPCTLDDCLFFVYAKEKYSLIEILIECGIGVDQMNEEGDTLLLLAVNDGNLHVVTLLLGCGADVSKSSSRGESSLYRAAGCGNLAILKALVQAGADVNRFTPYFTSVLSHAMENRQYDSVQYLLEKGANPDLFLSNNLEYTPLHFAILDNSMKCVEMLVKHGANVRIKSKGSSQPSPLFCAIKQGNRSMCDFLLRNGASASSRSLSISPISFAQKHGEDEIVLLLKQYKKERKAIPRASRRLRRLQF